MSQKRYLGIKKKTLIRTIIIAVLISIVLLTFIWFIINYSYKAIITANSRNQVETELNYYKSAFEKAVYRREALLLGLEAFTCTYMDDIESKDFELYVSGLYSSVSGVRNFIIAPKGINEFVYPIEGNEEAVGHDLIHDDREQVRLDVEKAIQSQSTVVSGPYELRQGGMGIIFRKAVYDEGEFWGLVTMALDIDAILDISGLLYEDINMEIMIKNEDITVFGDKDISDEDPVIIPINLINSELEIMAVPKVGWDEYINGQLKVFRYLLTIIIFLTGSIIVMLAISRRSMKTAIEQKTFQISQMNKELMEDLDTRNNIIDKLKLSENRFNNALSSLPDGVVIYDQEMLIKYVNKEFCRVFDIDKKDVINKERDYIWNSGNFDYKIAGRMDSNNHGNEEMKIEYSNKPARNLLVTKVPLIYQNDEVIQTMELIHDFTDLKNSMDNQTKQSRILKEIESVAKIGGWEFDVETGEGTWTDEVALIHDMDPLEVTSEEIGLKFYHGKSRKKINKAIKTAIDKGKKYNLELELITAKGTHKWVRTIGEPVVEDGKVIRLRGSIQDITEKKLIENEIKESEARYKNLFNTSPMGIAVHSDGKLVMINPAGMKIIGAKTRKQVIGKSVYEIIDKQGLEASKQRIKRMLDGEKGLYPAQDTYIKLDGSKVPVEVWATLLKYKNQPAVQVIVNDISERKRMEKKIKQQTSNLEKQVQERTRQLTKANKELDAFAYSIAHDLKAPLRGVDGYSRLLLEDYYEQLSDEGRQFLTSIRKSSERMGQLIDELLTYSKIERRPLEKERTNLKGLIESIIQALKADYNVTDIIIKNNIPSDLVVPYREMVSMAMKNLIENAILYSDINKKRMVIIEADINREITIEVIDNGIGFDMKYHEKIFNIFERLHRAEEYPGTGVGLSIVKKAAERMNGKVWAKSEPGKGSTFYFKIPKEG